MTGYWQRRILLQDVTMDGSEYTLVNIYNANIESKQIKVLNALDWTREKGQYNPKKTNYFCQWF